MFITAPYMLTYHERAQSSLCPLILFHEDLFLMLTSNLYQVLKLVYILKGILNNISAQQSTTTSATTYKWTGYEQLPAQPVH